MSRQIIYNVKQRKGQYLATFLASGGSFVSGTALGWSSAVYHKLVFDVKTPKKHEDCELRFCVSQMSFIWIISILSIGALFISIFTRDIIHHLGTKSTQFIFIFPITLGWVSTLVARSQIMIFAGRFFVGLSCGAYSVIIPVYVNEIAEKAIRGRLLAWCNFMQYAGISFVYGIGLFANIFQMNLICSIIICAYGIGLLFLPESPMHLIKKEEINGAISAIKKLYGRTFDAVGAVNHLIQEEYPENVEEPSEWSQLWNDNHRALYIVIGLSFFLHTSGIYPLIFTLSDHFDSCLTTLDSDLISLIVALTMLISSLICVMTIDFFGRRKLLLFSTAGMIVMSCCMVAYFYFEHCCDEYVDALKDLSVIFTSLYIGFCAVGLGPITFVLMAELFNSKVCHVAMSFSTMFSYFLIFSVTMGFYPILQSIELAGVYAIFTLSASLAFVFVIFAVPETKGKSKEEIEDLLKNRGSQRKKTENSSFNEISIRDVDIKSYFQT